MAAVSPATRNTILGIHRWTGLTVGLVAAFLAVTGLAMVFRPQLQPVAERGLNVAASCHARLALDDLIARARESHPGPEVLQAEASRAGATIVRFTDMQGVYVDPCTGAIVGEKNRWGGFFGLAEWLHRLRFAGDTEFTELVGGSVSLVVAIVIVGGGLVVVWPRNMKALRNALKPRWRLAGAAFDASLHRTVGLYVCAVLLVSTLTSLTFTFEWARHAIFTAAGSPMPAKKPRAAQDGGATLPAEAFMARTLAMLPDAREIQILFPRKPGDAVEIQALASGAPHANARDFLYLDPATGSVLRVQRYASSGAGNRVYRWLGALHQGQLGLALQLVLFAGILGVPFLAFTGARGFLRRKLASRL